MAGVRPPANSLEDVSRMPALLAVLLKRGYAESDLKRSWARIICGSAG